MTAKGVIAAGHPETAAAAAAILAEGGNAFDAVLAAVYTACAVEPVLSSLRWIFTRSRPISAP